MPDAPLLDRAFLEKLERLTIQWQRSFTGLVGGHNASRFAGGGQEFLDHRNFHHGDDPRAVNWRAYLRLDKLFLKMFQIEPRVPVQIMIDISESMAVRNRAKFDYARRLAGALAYVGLVRLDTMAIMPFSSRLGEGKRVGGGTPSLQSRDGLPHRDWNPRAQRTSTPSCASSCGRNRSAGYWSSCPTFSTTADVSERSSTSRISDMN